MRVYIRFIAMNFKSQMQYPISLLLSVLGQFFTAFTMFFGLHFVLERVRVIEGFTYGQTLLCYAVVMSAFAIGEAFGGGFAVFPRLLGNGEFDRALVRPRGVILQVLAPKMDFSRAGLLLQAAVVLGIALPVSGVVWTGKAILILCLMILSGSVIFFSLFLANAACSFFLLEDLQFLNIFTYGGRQFGRYPFSVYGREILKFLTYVIPLALFQYYPLLYLMGREESVFYALAPALGLIFALPCHSFFRFGLRHYQSTGS